MIAQPLFDQFSAASQKYKTGILRVIAEGIFWELVVVDGRVIDVAQSDDRDRLQILDRLAKTGTIKSSEQMKLAGQKMGLPQLETFLVQQKKMSSEQFTELRAHVAVDALFEIGRQPELECEFFFHPVRDHKGPGISINFGQFLLDVVEFSVDEERANEVLHSMWRGKSLAVVGEVPERLLPFEQLLLSLVEFPCSFQDLEAAAMTRYELIEGILSLLDQGVLALQGEEIDEYSSEEEVERLKKRNREAAEAARRARAAAAASEQGPAVLSSDGRAKGLRTPSGRLVMQQSFRDTVINLNYQLLEEGQLQRVILITNELVLLAVLICCLTGPQIIDTLFRALSEFTSSLLASHGTINH